MLPRSLFGLHKVESGEVTINNRQIRIGLLTTRSDRGSAISRKIERHWAYFRIRISRQTCTSRELLSGRIFFSRTPPVCVTALRR